MRETRKTTSLQGGRLALAAVLLGGLTTGPLAAQSDGNPRMSVTVAFGAGMNTAQMGNTANHHVLPKVIEIKAGGVVNFAVAGFHHIVVYQPGTVAENIIVPPTGVFVNDMLNVFYTGIIPAGGPPATPATLSPSNASNRVESVSFKEPGVYLVICNIRVHFNDGMYAYVKVSS